MLFIVSNPPFLGLLGFFFKLIRKQRYAILTYDVYPDILVALGKMSDGLIAQAWRFMNRLILQHADLVFVISDDMAALVDQRYDLRNTAAGKSVVVPNWADIEVIRPIEKKDNWFAKKYQQVDKITVLYSGNMGNAHDIETIIAAARRLQKNEGIHFLLIGEGAKWSLVERAVKDHRLSNVTLLPFQSEDVLPYSMASGDIGIVTYQPGTEGCIVPSKTYYYMAAGLVPLVISSRDNDLSRMVEDQQCGFAIMNGDVDGMVKTVLQFEENRGLLANYKNSARTTAERFYSRRNTGLFVEAIASHSVISE
jgi:glycosyltransferase involved in cell wall biosynthesis